MPREKPGQSRQMVRACPQAMLLFLIVRSDQEKQIKPLRSLRLSGSKSFIPLPIKKNKMELIKLACPVKLTQSQRSVFLWGLPS
jgi:hypothetical protein